MPPTPFKTDRTRRLKRLDIRLTTDEWKAIRKQARGRGASMNAVVLDALRRQVPGVANPDTVPA